MEASTMALRFPLTTLTLAASLAFPLAAHAQDKPATAIAETTKGVATVQKIDAKTREVTLKREDGSTVTIVAGDEVRNFDQIRVGDVVETEIIEALAIAVEPASTKVLERREELSGYRAQPGERPGAKTTRTVEITAEVKAVDEKARTAVVKGPNRTVEITVADDVDLSNVKVGDNVRVVFIESISIQVKSAPK
jgi:Cu/Ag efflux protein CusF